MADKATGRYADPGRIHPISHRGQYFSVAGPLNVERPPQGHPLLVQAGSSEDGKDFAARHAEAIFTAHQTYERAADFYADIKQRARAAGRDPDGVIVLPGIVPVHRLDRGRGSALARQFDELRIPAYGLLAAGQGVLRSSRATSSSTPRCPTRCSPDPGWKARRAAPT